jgi:hypothetical protein
LVHIEYDIAAERAAVLLSVTTAEPSPCPAQVLAHDTDLLTPGRPGTIKVVRHSR